LAFLDKVLRKRPYPRTSDRDTFLGRASEKCRDFRELWDARRGGRPMPARRDFEPEDFRRWLPWVTLVDVVALVPLTLRYRLVGTGHVALRGFDPTGMNVEDGYFGRSLEEVRTNYRTVVTERTFVYDWDDRLAPSGRLLSTEILMLPLSADGDRVDMILVYGEGLDTRD
jgi:hypothetical protein